MQEIQLFTKVEIIQNEVDSYKVLIINSYKPATSLLIFDDSSSSLIGMTYSLAVSINIRKNYKITKWNSWKRQWLLVSQKSKNNSQCYRVLFSYFVSQRSLKMIFFKNMIYTYDCVAIFQLCSIYTWISSHCLPYNVPC